MDCCGGDDDPAAKEEAKRSKELDSELKKASKKENDEIKLLLLGAGESGKSTIFKQFKILYQEGFSKEDYERATSVIHSNVVASMKALLNACKKFDLPLDGGHDEYGEMVSQVEEQGVFKLTAEQCTAIKTLWESDSSIKAAYERRAEFQLNDSADYFFEHLDRIASADYAPTDSDMLRMRVRTLGITEACFEVDQTMFKVYDVGGQRSERRKWIHCFEDVTAVIFIVGLSEYDQMLLEDETKNRMDEAIELFNEICNSRWFEKTSFILFLNKKDLFAEKIKKVDLKKCFADYTGGCNYENALAYICEEFRKLNVNSDEKQIYIKETCATDTQNIKFTFNVVKDIILQANMRNANIM